MLCLAKFCSGYKFKILFANYDKLLMINEILHIVCQHQKVKRTHTYKHLHTQFLPSWPVSLFFSPLIKAASCINSFTSRVFFLNWTNLNFSSPKSSLQSISQLFKLMLWFFQCSVNFISCDFEKSQHICFVHITDFVSLKKFAFCFT